MSEVKVNKVTPRSGTTLTIGDSGDTTNVVGTLQNNGAALVGDISSVVAGTNLSGGGTSGAVTINLADASTSAKGAASFSSDNFAASSGAVTIKDLGIATGEIQDDAITLAKMASGTDGNIISYDTSGNPVAVATGSAGQVLTSAGAGAIPTFATIESGIAWQSSIVTGTTLTAVAGRGYWINTTSNVCTVTLPNSASVGDDLIFVDYAGTWGSNNLIINSNSLKFQGTAVTARRFNVNNQTLHIIYSGATKGWTPIEDSAVQAGTYSSSFLVVAGGGAGNGNTAGSTYGSAGGGAGGLRSSWNSETSGGGASSESDAVLTRGIAYTIDVGAGGAGGIRNHDANSGSNSSISGTGLTTITSIGGGGSNNAGKVGGSGGGGGLDTFSGGAGTSGQGYAGGSANWGGSSPITGGGGGGASEVGNTDGQGTGGDGRASTIMASSIIYGGGGGGGAVTSSHTSGGGTGGGGNGGPTSGDDAENGSANTGGGGGGGSYRGGSNNTNGGTGGSGIIVLRLLTANYSGITTGSPAVTTSGSDTIIKFTGDGSYTA